MAKGMVSVKEYFQVLSTGQLDTMIEGPEAENMYIVEENELLRKGQPCVVSPTDNHALHIPQHNSITFDTTLRANPNNPVLTVTLQHMMAHAQVLIPDVQGPTDPRFLALLGIQVAPPMMGPPGPQQPTPHPVANPMPASHGAHPPQHPGSGTVGNNPVPVHKPTLPGNTPAPTAAAAQHGPLPAHMPGIPGK